MSQYKNILVAIDLGEDTTSILRRGLAIAGSRRAAAFDSCYRATQLCLWR